MLALTGAAAAQEPARLSIFPAIEVEFTTDADTLYQLEGSSDLVNWASIDPPQCGTGSPVTLLLSTREHPALRFFRLQVVETQSDCSNSATRNLILTGHTEHVAVAANILGVGNLSPLQNVLPAPNDAVLFTVSAVDGPMPQTREEINAIKGRPRGPAAIFVVDSFRQLDLELRDLILLEMRELLKSLQQPAVDALPVIFDDETAALDEIRDLLEHGEGP